MRQTDQLGRHVEKSVIATSKTKARANFKALNANIASQQESSTDIRFGELFESLLETVYKVQVRNSTLNLYRGLWRNHLLPLKEIYVRRLTPAILEELFRSPNVGRSTRQLLRRVVIGFLNHAVRLDYVTEILLNAPFRLVAKPNSLSHKPHKKFW